jgi:hypothetical protein
MAVCHCYSVIFTKGDTLEWTVMVLEMRTLRTLRTVCVVFSYVLYIGKIIYIIR